MSRFRLSFAFTLALLFSAGPVLASSYAVGSCKPTLPSYSSISAAVAAVPSGSTIMVCPGTYYEQVTISQPLTLEGISNGNSSQVVIAVPPSGLVVNVATTAAQVLVTAGPVNITNITIDGQNNNLNGSASIVGLYYEDASGVINQVATRNQFDPPLAPIFTQGMGSGVVVVGGGPVTIENCSIQDFDDEGIYAGGDLTVTVRANYVNAINNTGSVFGVYISGVASVTGNTVTGPGNFVGGQGFTAVTATATLSGNVVTDWTFGMVDYSGATFTSNTVRDSYSGFGTGGTGATINSNIITDSAYSGIDFFCLSNGASHNTISDAFVGLSDVPSSFSSINTLYNVPNIRTDGCTSPSPDASKGAEKFTLRKAARN